MAFHKKKTILLIILSKKHTAKPNTPINAKNSSWDIKIKTITIKKAIENSKKT